MTQLHNSVQASLHPIVSGVGASNAVVAYESDAAFQDDEDLLKDSVWDRAGLIMRAFKAYKRSIDAFSYEDAGFDQWPSPTHSHTDWMGGVTYILLNYPDGIVAVYRLDSRRKLKRMKRWPKELGQGSE